MARLTNEEVGQEMVRNLSCKMHMQDKANAVGYLMETNHILCNALSMQGRRGPPTKPQQMAQRAVDILKRAQKVASHKLWEPHEKTESED